MNVKVFYKDNCVKCKLTIRQFRSKGIEPKLVNALEQSNSNEMLDKFRMENMRAFPVVKVSDDNGTILKWNDFDADKIKEAINLLTA